MKLPIKGAVATRLLTDDLVGDWLYIDGKIPATLQLAAKAAVTRIEDRASAALDRATYSIIFYEIALGLPDWYNVAITTVVDSDDNTLAHTFSKGCITLSDGAQANGATVTFFAGYGGDDAGSELRIVALQLTAHLWEHRGDDNVDTPTDVLRAIAHADTWSAYG